MKTTREIFCFLTFYEFLDDEVIDLYWKATSIDYKSRNQLLNFVEELSGSMKSWYRVKFLNKFKEEKKLISQNDIQFVFNISKITSKYSLETRVASELLWKFMIEEEYYTAISQAAMTNLCLVLNG